MKVALVGAFPPQQKGEAWYLGEYALALREEIGPESIVVVSQYTDAPSKDSWRDFAVDRAIRDRSLGRPSYAPQRELVEAVLRHRPDVVHVTYGPNQDYGGRLGEPLVEAIRRLRAAGIPTVITLHSLWLPEDVRSSPAAGRLPSFLRPLVVAYFGRFMRRLNAAAARILCLAANENSPMTRALGESYQLKDLGEEVFGCSPHFVPLPATGAPKIFAFGFVRPDKGFDVLLRAFAQYVREGGQGDLLIAGRPQAAADESYADELEQLAREVPAGRCRFERRFVPDDELERMVADSSLVVLPYLRNVGASGPLHIAIAAGRPIIATSAGHNAALRSVIDLVEPGDQTAIVAAMKAALASPDALRERVQKVVDFANRRSWAALAKTNAAIYDELLGIFRTQ
ncbi:MAG TPA: glycosyltransferase [Candidatus Eremiobacteraceae bacterium]|nr:glycosyltransferase [Candidatus Eremiobacteraceae bacterium]